MRMVLQRVLVLLLVLGAGVGFAQGGGRLGEVSLPENVRREAEACLARGKAWLQAQQAASGRIGTNEHVAVTALALKAVREAGGRWEVLGGSAAAGEGWKVVGGSGAGTSGQGKRSTPNVQHSTSKEEERTEKYLREFVGKAPTNAVTCDVEICRKILNLPGKAGQQDWASYQAVQDRDDSARAREFEFREIAWQKQRAELQKQGRDPDQFAAESLARVVVPSSGPMPDVSPRGGTRGPPLLAAGSPAKPEPRRIRRGYGSMTYEGMMRLVQEDPKPNDPRVDAMLDWAERGWSLDENPGKGKAGLFYFYHAMSKCLDASGENEITPMIGGTPIRWREQFAKRLVALQHVAPDGKSGYWVNEDQNYMENDPVLVTSYAMLALERALGMRE